MIYLDHNATTPIDPEVRAEIVACLDIFGNPSSVHAAGQQARRVLDTARARVARLIGAQPDEIVFTGSGTEANNLAVFGAVGHHAADPAAVAASAIEHQAVLNPCRELERRGVKVRFLPVDRDGLLDLDGLDDALAGGVRFVSVMLANNDVGVIQPLAEIVSRARRRGAVVHCDAVQAVGKIAVHVPALDVDFLSFSAHKIYGPKGVGALYVRGGRQLAPLCFGGHQEHGRRPGTENVAGIAGFGKACELAAARLNEDAARLAALRVSFEDQVAARIPDAVINARSAPRLPNTSNISFPGLDGELLVINLDLLGVAASTGSACSSADRAPSYVLTAMGRSAEEARASIRISLGRSNDEQQLRQAVEAVCRAVEMIRRR